MSTPTTSTGRTTGQAAQGPAAPANWQTRSKCGTRDAHLFFPDKGTNEDYAHAQAKKICARCPVREACLSDALDSWEAYGVRGGLTAKEREKLLGRNRLPARGRHGDPEPMWQQILRVSERREELLKLHGRGCTVGRIAAALHTNTHTINRVLAEIAAEDAALDAAPEAVAA